VFHESTQDMAADARISCNGTSRYFDLRRTAGFVVKFLDGCLDWKEQCRTTEALPIAL
jgi:hypothetical protein